MRRQGSEPRAVTANIGQATRPTSTMRHPLASASPLPDGLLMRQDHFSVLNYDPGYNYGYCPNIQEGMDSVSMSHLAYPPLTPVSPLPHPRDQTQARLNSQNLTIYAERTRIQKVSSVVMYIQSDSVSYRVSYKTLGFLPFQNKPYCTFRGVSHHMCVLQAVTDLQRQICSLSVSEADQAFKRDRLAFELRYDTERDDVKAV